MHISRRAAAVGAPVFIGLASLGAAGAAFAAALAAHNRVQVLRLHTKAVSAVVNHAGHGGPGDVDRGRVRPADPGRGRASQELPIGGTAPVLLNSPGHSG